MSCKHQTGAWSDVHGGPHKGGMVNLWYFCMSENFCYLYVYYLIGMEIYSEKINNKIVDFGYLCSFDILLSFIFGK